jgi:hypothetical protein
MRPCNWQLAVKIPSTLLLQAAQGKTGDQLDAVGAIGRFASCLVMFCQRHIKWLHRVVVVGGR